MAQTAEILEALPPAQEQPAGLALLDLNVTATPLVITWDKDAVSALLDAVLAQYVGLEVQEADVPAIKNEMAGLNRLRERMDNARKDIKRRIAGPLDGFDAEVKALIARIVDARIALDMQRSHPELQIVGPGPEKFFRRGDYGVGKFFDATISNANQE